MQLISFVTEGALFSVLESQVVVPLGVIGRKRPDIRRALLVLTSVRYRRDPRLAARQAAIRAALPGATVVFRNRLPMNVPFQQGVWARMLAQALQVCRYDQRGPIVVHCRGDMTVAAAARLRRRDPRLRLLFDMRGAQVDEIRPHGLLNRYRKLVAQRLQRQALADADGLNTVSSKLAAYLRQTGQLGRSLPMSVVGCCADTALFRFDPEQRAARRRELGFDGRFVVCYCGAMWHWQRPDAVAEAFAAIHRAMPDAHMFVLSSDAEQFVAHLTHVGVAPEHLTTRAAAHQDVPSYLMAADVGLLLRENTLTNRVASPVKFAEYLRCGLPVITTPYVGDLSDFVAREGVGALVDFPVRADEVVAAARGLQERLQREGDGFRELCSRRAGETYSWDVQVDQLLDIYERLAGAGSRAAAAAAGGL